MSGVEHPDSFYMSLRPLFILGQIAGLLPLSGTWEKTHTKLKFKWWNLQFIYILTILFTTVFFNVCSTIENIRDGIRLDNFGSTVFYTVCIANILFFIDISRCLPSLCHYIFKLEMELSSYGYPTLIGRRIKIFLFIVLTVSIIEHSLLTFLNVKGALEMEDVPFLKAFFTVRFPVIMGYTGEGDFIVVFIFIVNVICTINWNFLDWFLVCMSSQVSNKLKKINIVIQEATKRPNDMIVWKKLHEDYNKMSIFTRRINSKISKLILMSFASNLYHLSLQLLRSLRFNGDEYAKVYFYFSLIYLIARTLSVALSGSHIQDESKASLPSLYAMQKPCAPALRLIEQVISDDVSINGNRFFTVDRSFVVGLTGTLITYEVILLQFNSLRYQEKSL